MAKTIPSIEYQLVKNNIAKPIPDWGGNSPTGRYTEAELTKNRHIKRDKPRDLVAVLADESEVDPISQQQLQEFNRAFIAPSTSKHVRAYDFAPLQPEINKIKNVEENAAVSTTDLAKAARDKIFNEAINSTATIKDPIKRKQTLQNIVTRIAMNNELAMREDEFNRTRSAAKGYNDGETQDKYAAIPGSNISAMDAKGSNAMNSLNAQQELNRMIAEKAWQDYQVSFADTDATLKSFNHPDVAPEMRNYYMEALKKKGYEFAIKQAMQNTEAAKGQQQQQPQQTTLVPAGAKKKLK